MTKTSEPSKSIKQLSAPSKTFLLGEYLALFGGPTLILNTTPQFTLTATPLQHPPTKTFNYHAQCHNISATSPAGKFITYHTDFFQRYESLQFTDPHHESGGFGASSAQFLMAVALQAPSLVNTINCQNIEKLLTLYRQFAWDGEGIPPSGADLISQLTGHLTYYHQTTKTLQTFTWPFDEIQCYLLHTRNKIPTHRHLRDLPTLKPTFIDELHSLADTALYSIQNQDIEILCGCVNQYAALLQKQKLVAPTTQTLLTQLHELPHMLAAKGCGALGADVILVLAHREHHNEMMGWIKQQKLPTIMANTSLSTPLKISDFASRQGTLVSRSTVYT